MNTQIIDFEQSVKNSFENEFYTLINNIKCNLSIKNIQLLNYFNSNFQTLINELKEINTLLQKNPNEEIVQNKIQQYLSFNKKINELLPSLILETI